MLVQRAVLTMPATIRHAFAVDETPEDSSTAVSVSVVDPAGAVVQTGTATLTMAGSGMYSIALTPQAMLTRLAVTWSATITGVLVQETDYVDVVGGRFFSLAEGRASDASLRDVNKYSTADLLAALLETEQECEEICDRAFVPRYRAEVIGGSGSSEMSLAGSDIRSIRAVSMANRVGQTFTPLTSLQLAALAVTPDGTITRTDGAVWTDGLRNVLVEYECGLDAPPPDLVRAAKIRFRSWAQMQRSGIPERAVSYTTENGATYRLSQPGAWTTGIPDVDAIYGRYSLRDGAGASGGTGGRSAPASRPLNYDPQRYSIFHGGVR